MTVIDVSHHHRRARQESVVELLTKLTAMADSAELVGCVILYVDKEGTWHHKRDLFNSDSPALIGYLDILRQNLVHKYLTGKALVNEDGDES